MPQSREVHKEYMRKRREGSQKGIVHRQGSQKEGMGITAYHPVLDWLVDPVKRRKLEAITQSVDRHKQTGPVYLGAGVHSLPLDSVAEMLDATV